MRESKKKIQRLDTIIQEYISDQDWIPASQKALKHIIHIADVEPEEDYNKALLFTIDLMLKINDNNLEETIIATKKVIISYAEEVKLVLQLGAD